MNWKKTTQYQTKLNYKEHEFLIIVQEGENGMWLSIDLEPVCDVDKLPTKEEIIKHIDENHQLNYMARAPYPGAI